jgi:hypothetical protein
MRGENFLLSNPFELGSRTLAKCAGAMVVLGGVGYGVAKVVSMATDEAFFHAGDDLRHHSRGVAPTAQR